MGFFFCGVDTGVEQGGAAKPRTKVSSGDFRSPREPPPTGTDINPKRRRAFWGFSFVAWIRGSNRAARQSRALSRYAATIVPVASYRRCRAVMRDSVILSLAFMLVGVFCFEALPSQVISIFSREAEVFAVGIPAFRIIGLSFFSAVFSLITPVFFQAIGAAKVSVAISVMREIICLIPIFWLLSRLGLGWTWWAFPLSETISGGFGLVLYLRQIHRWPDV